MSLFARQTVNLMLALAVLASASPIFAQTPSGIVRGEVTDASGGVLPGVTVVATRVDGRVITTTVTDAVGRYVLRALPAGIIWLEFQLDGFDTARVQLTVQPGGESAVVERLKLAQFTESVVVYADAPAEAAASSRIAWQPPRPTIIPVPAEEMESICLPAKPGITTDALGTIQSHRSEAGRMLYTKGDELNIDGGTLNGLEVGRNLVVRRHFRTASAAVTPTIGEQTSGLVQIVAAGERSSTAVVVHACSEVMQGDYLAWFIPEPVRTPEPPESPRLAMQSAFSSAMPGRCWARRDA